MDRFESGAFEESWAKKFEGASTTYSEGLWEKIDHELTFQENKKLRGVLFWTRAAAAAALALAITVVGYNMYFGNTEIPKQETIFVENNPVQSESEINRTSESSQPEQSTTSIEQEENFAPSTETPNNLKTNSRQLVNSPPLMASIDQTDENSSQARQNIIDGSPANVNTLGQNKFKLDYADPMALSPIKLGKSPEMEERYVYRLIFEEKEEKYNDFWAGISFAGGNVSSQAGGFSAMEAVSGDPYFDGGNLSANNYSSRSIDGTSSVVGLSVGKQFTKRLSLISGLHYANVVSGTYIGNDMNISTQNITMARESFSNTTSTDPAILQEDQFDYITIPVKTGIKIIDNKIGLDLITGVDSRILIDESSRQEAFGTLNNVSINRNANPLHFWGSLNVELNYLVADNYQVSLSPGYKMSFNPMESGSREHQSLAELSFSFRYLFNPDN